MTSSSLVAIVTISLWSASSRADNLDPETNPHALEWRPPLQLGLAAGWADPACKCDLSGGFIVRGFGLWRIGQVRLGAQIDHAEFQLTSSPRSTHTFAGPLARLYLESGAWDVHLGLAFGWTYSPRPDDCGAGPIWFSVQPAVGFDVWLGSRWAAGLVAAYTVPTIGSSASCGGGSGESVYQIYEVGSIAFEVSWGALPAKPP